MLVPLHALEGKVGTGTPRQNLGVALAGLMKFHDRVNPMLCSVMTEPELPQRFKQSLDHTAELPRWRVTLSSSS
jgi:hypothetical protein